MCMYMSKDELITERNNMLIMLKQLTLANELWLRLGESARRLELTHAAYILEARAKNIMGDNLAWHTMLSDRLREVNDLIELE